MEGVGGSPYRRLQTPRAAGIAGVVFSVLFGASLILLRTALGSNPHNAIDWSGQAGTRVRLAMMLMPFAGMAFLWFIGVIRDRMGELEDRFFSTVSLGSGLLFVAMVFVSMAIAGGLLATAGADLALDAERGLTAFGRAVMLQISNVYALRMGGVFMLSLGTVWLRTGLMPRWLVVTTYLLALAMLVIVNLSLWVTLIFPVWVFVVSVYVLVERGDAGSGAGTASFRSPGGRPQPERGVGE
jgi:hypothetical protein